MTLPGGEQLEPIAGNGSGGTLLLVGADTGRPVLHVGSEGEGGLVVGVLSLHDVPVEEDDGRALCDFLTRTDDQTREDWPELDDDRDRLHEALARTSSTGRSTGRATGSGRCWRGGKTPRKRIARWSWCLWSLRRPPAVRPES